MTRVLKGSVKAAGWGRRDSEGVAGVAVGVKCPSNFNQRK